MIRRGDVPRSRGEETVMAKGGNAVYRVTEVIGTSTQSWEDAAKNAVKTAKKSSGEMV